MHHQRPPRRARGAALALAAATACLASLASIQRCRGAGAFARASGRRPLLPMALAAAASVLAPVPAPAEQPPAAEAEALGRALRLLQSGRARDLEEAELLLGGAVGRWRLLGRPRSEVAQLLLLRAKARQERNELAGGTLRELLEGARDDYTQAIADMRADTALAPVRPDGTAEYQEFPDAFVRRGLASEGLQQWQSAVDDYTMAIELWGGVSNDFRNGEFSEGGRLGVNPFVLNFRGNALSRLGRYALAAEDYRAAGRQFGATSERTALATSLSNEALARFGAGQTQEAQAIMERVRLRDPKNVDARAVLAAVYWSRGERDRAESEWQAACDSEQGLDACSRYKDPKRSR
ncbi:unnamed protein product [Prorocentrum cordatum]|uniref:Tetratricopeptide repeat protein n=1 Tax=Prorocentrum cordatum TaxID=2364126 RepID=A0ABN9QLV6_9DINO|nr:unnamed protein product [Polarella glacialis]